LSGQRQQQQHHQQQEETQAESKPNADGTDSTQQPRGDDVFRSVLDYWDGFRSEVSLAWKGLLEAGQRQSINKKITVLHPHATDGAPEYTGPLDLVAIDPSENLTAWERMQKRLSDTPIIAGMVQRSEQLYESTGAKQVKERVDHLREDAKEAWETSQNPWVYRISSVYDTLTAETPESVAVKELRVLDPTFTLEDWRRDVVEHTLPQIMTWFLEGHIAQLQPWLGEGVFRRIAAEITARKQEGVEIDTHVLGIMNSEILAVEVSP
jgi:Tim44-like domain